MKILVIDDEAKIAELIKKSLEMEKFKVDLSHDGEDGLNKAKNGKYDLLVLDVMLPKMDGLEVCRALRKEKFSKPIILLTAKDAPQDKIAGLGAGADDYMVKPFSLQELSSRINSLLGEKNIEKENKQKVFAKSREKREKKQSNDLHQKILDNVPVSIITINKEGFMTSANKFYKNLSRNGVCHLHSIFSNNFFKRENLIDEYKKLLADGTPFERENIFEINSKGEEKYLKITAVPIRDADGKIEGALSMAIDNTEAVLFKKKLQDLNLELEEKIRQRTTELDKVNNELNKVIQIKSSFMADVSHEMRTSLAIIQCNLELLKMTQDNANASDEDTHLQIFEEIKRMSTMLSDLSLLSNAEASEQLKFSRFDLNEKILAACKSLKVLADEKKISIKYSKAKRIEIIADEAKIEKMLFNLIKNAIKYNKTNGWIKVSTLQKEKEIILKIEDGGIGIAQKHLPFIFERFYRADKSRSRNVGGSGLGLAICKWVVQTHKGTIKVNSQLEEGTIFTVKLPNDCQQAKLLTKTI